MFYWHEDVPPVPGAFGYTWGFTSGPGGHSEPPCDGWNLGTHVGDDPGAVRANRAALADRVGVDLGALTFMNQVHGAAVAEVGAPGWPGEAPDCDAVLTGAVGRALVVLVADCVPVLLADPVLGICAAVHAGRRGLVLRVVERTVEALRTRGSEDLRAVVGPSVCAGCYEVPELLRAEAAAVSPASHGRSWAGTPAIDLGAGVLDQLAGLGVAAARVPGCTREDPALYSHRRGTPTGRFAGVVVVRSVPGRERAAWSHETRMVRP